MEAYRAEARMSRPLPKKTRCGGRGQSSPGVGNAKKGERPEGLNNTKSGLNKDEMR